jgi:hypothetical protein
MGTLDEIRKSVHDLTADPDELTPAEGLPSDPSALICRPIKTERARRKVVDESTYRRLRIVDRKATITMWGVAAMVAFATLEYLGIMGNGQVPTWARSIFEGVAFALGKS